MLKSEEMRPKMTLPRQRNIPNLSLKMVPAFSDISAAVCAVDTRGEIMKTKVVFS